MQRDPCHDDLDSEVRVERCSTLWILTDTISRVCVTNISEFLLPNRANLKMSYQSVNQINQRGTINRTGRPGPGSFWSPSVVHSLHAAQSYCSVGLLALITLVPGLYQGPLRDKITNGSNPYRRKLTVIVTSGPGWVNSR